MDIDRKIELYTTRGWCPVPWAQHPQAIKDLIRLGCFRPKMKSCFENCLRLVLTAARRNRESGLFYCEGWAGSLIPMEHAWLLFNGEIVDLTLPDRDVEYGEHRCFTPAEAVAGLVRTCVWGPISNLSEIGPYAEALRLAREATP